MLISRVQNTGYFGLAIGFDNNFGYQAVKTGICAVGQRAQWIGEQPPVGNKGAQIGVKLAVIVS